MFCCKEGRLVRIQMLLLAYIADQPERHSIIHQTQGGTFGRRTLWSAVLDCKHLPYCNRCFSTEMACLLSDKFSPTRLHQCSRCCQWDMASKLVANTKVKASEIKMTEKYPRECSATSPSAPVHRGCQQLICNPCS